MNYEQKEVIHDYFNLKNSIRMKKERLKYFELKFNHSNFYGKTAFDNNDRINYQGFRLDTRVINHVDHIAIIEKQLTIIERKQYHFKQFLKELEPNVLSSLKRRYTRNISGINAIQSMPSDSKLWDEILEIEEAISYEFKDKNQLTTFKIEQAEFSNETLEESLGNIFEYLEV